MCESEKRKYYIRDNDPDTIDRLLDSITEDISADVILTALVYNSGVTILIRSRN